MLSFKWLKAHKKEIKILIGLTFVLLLILLILSYNRTRFLVEEENCVVAVKRGDGNQAITFPLEVEVKENGEIWSYEVILSLKNIEEGKQDETTGTDTSQLSKQTLMEDEVQNLVHELENQKGAEITLPNQLEDGTKLRWKKKKDFRFFFVFLLPPASLLYIYEAERQREKQKRNQYETEIRRALPSFVDQILLLLNCGMIFQDAFYRIAANYEKRSTQDAFCQLLCRIQKEVDDTGTMVITVLRGLSQEVGIREYVRLVNIITDHEHRGIGLEDKLQAESRLLWESRKAEARQKGRELETKLTFPLALLLAALIMIAGTPALMNM